jgi:DNA replication protein DnaC
MATQEIGWIPPHKEIACQVCGDIGWQIKKWGETETAERCQCQRSKRQEQRRLKARIPDRYLHCSLENYEIHPGYDGSQERAKMIVEQFVKDYPAVETGLLLMGSCGVGKTHLAVATIKELIEKAIPCLFYDFRDLIKELQDTYSSDSESSEFDVLKPVLTKEVLVLDELGARKMSPWAQEMLTHILIQRYNKKLITLITCNWMDEGYKGIEEETLEQRIGYRLRSRLYEMCRTIVIRGPDHRQYKQSRY